MSTASKVFFLYWSLTVSIQTSQCLPSKQCQRGELIKLSDLQVQRIPADMEWRHITRATSI